MTLSLAAIYAALSEEVYQRDPRDIPLKLQAIFDSIPSIVSPPLPSSLVANSDTGMIYSSTGDGFAAQVIKVGANYVVAFRGTDLGGTTFDFDAGDLRSDAALGAGTDLHRQVADLQALMTAVNDLAARDNNANVTVVGQSLGGGLALLAGALYGVQTYAYDPAPFALELWTMAYQQAAQELNLSGIIDSAASMTSDVISRLTSANPAVTSKAAAYMAGYLQNLTNANLVQAYRVAGEVLSVSNNWLSFGISKVASKFDSVGLAVTTLNAGIGDGSTSDSISLHHPALIALLLKEASLNDASTTKPSLAQLTNSDAALRNALWDEGQIIAGPNDHDRTDPANINGAAITSKVAGGGQQTGILYRALWLDDDFRGRFETAFQKIEYGTASSGLSVGGLPKYDFKSDLVNDHELIHRALLELGIRVVRDGIHSSASDGTLSVDPAARYVFDPIHNGDDVASPNGNYAIVRTDDFKFNDKNLADYSLIDDAHAAIDNAFEAMVDRNLNTAMGWSWNSKFSEPTLPWKVLVVQDGAAGASMNYAPTEEVADKSHMIFGGSGNDEIYGSSETDYIFAGDGNDTLMLGNEPQGGGKGDFIDGGAGWDTLDYSFSNSPIKFGLIQEIRYHEDLGPIIKENYVVSDDLDGYRHDVATNVESIIAPWNPNFVNYFNMNSSAGFHADRITLYAGTNFITGVNEGDFIDGEGGFNIVELPLGWQFWSVTRKGNDWVAKLHHSPGVVDPYEVDLHGVQALTFWEDDYGLFGAGGFINNTPLALDHYGENNNGGTLWASATPGAPNLYTLHDENSDNHEVKVEYYGAAAHHGTLTAAVQKETATSLGLNPDKNGVIPIHTNGAIALTYTPNPDAKYWGNEYYAVTISEKDNGYKTTFFVRESTGGTLYAATASLADGSTPATGTVGEAMESAANGTASTSGSIAISNTYASDIETATYSFVSSSTGKPPVGKFSAEVQQNPDGGQHVVWNYVVDDDAFLRMAEGTSIQETYKLWVVDQFDMKSAPKDVVVTIAAKPSATTQIGVADSSGAVIQGQDPNDLQIASGKILLSDTDLKEMHSVAFKQVGGATDQGYFQVSIVADTAGTGAGELRWQYFIQNSKIAVEGNTTHSFDVAVADGRGGVVHQTVAITSYAFNPNAAPFLYAPATLMAQSGATASETGTFMDANFGAHHTLSVTSLDQGGSDWGQVSATMLQDSSWPTPGAGSYMLSYAPDLTALDALQDGQTHVEHWQISLLGDNGKSDSKTLTVVVGRPPDQTSVDPSASTTSAFLVADTHQTATEAASGSVSFVDAMTRDVHVLSYTFLSSDAGLTPVGMFAASLAADSTGGTAPGRVDWSYEAPNTYLEGLAPGQVVNEVWQLALDDGHGGTTLQNVTISLSKTPPNQPPVVTASHGDLFAQISEAAAITGSLAHDQASGVISFTDPDYYDAPTASISSVVAAYLDASGSPVTLTAAQQAAIASAFTIAPDPSNAQSGTLAWAFAPIDGNLDFLSRGERIQVKAVVTLDDGHGHAVDTPVSISIQGADDAPIVTAIDAGTVSETAAPLTIDLLQNASDPDRADTLHLASVPTLWSSDGHAVVADVTDHSISLDPTQFAYLGNGQQTTVTVYFSVSDGLLSSPGAATLVVTGTNEAPQIEAPKIQMDQRDQLTFIDLLKTATDADNSDALALVPGSLSVVASDGHQVQLYDYADGLGINPSQFAYLGANQKVELTVNYVVTDGISSTAGQQVIEVSGENDAPIPVNLPAITVSERDPIQYFDLLQGASDPDQGDTLSIVANSVTVQGPTGTHFADMNGTEIALDPSEFRYLHAGESDWFSVEYAVTDGQNWTWLSQRFLTVTGVDSPPTISPIDVGNVNANQVAFEMIDLLETADDPDGKSTLSIVGTPTVTASDGKAIDFGVAGSLLVFAPSQFDYLQWFQSDLITINYDVTDGQTTIHNTATMTVIGEVDVSAPRLILNGTTPATYTYSFNGLTNVSSPDQGVTYQYAIVAGSVSATSSDGHAVAVGNAAGSSTITMDRSQFTYLSVGEYTTVTFEYDVNIVGSSLPATHATATLQVMGVNSNPSSPQPSATVVTETSGQDVFGVLTGTLTATDPNLSDGQFWTGYNQAPADSVYRGTYGAAVIKPDGTYTIILSSSAINAIKSGTGVDSYWTRLDDGHGGSAFPTLGVNFVGTDDTPYSPYFNTGGAVLEHAANGTSVGTLKVIDPDTSDTVSWTLIDNAGGRFALSAGGALTVANGTLLDHAEAAGYDIVIKATDAAGQYVQQAIHVTLLQIPTATILGTSGIDTLTGTSGNDVIVGLAGGDTINAGAGDDLVLPGAGANHSDGGTGIDTISYVDNTTALTANLATGVISHGSSDTATNFENIIATSFDDTIYGTSGANVIDAGAGNDKIYGRGGNDVIDGGLGVDTVYFDDAASAVVINLQTGFTGGAAAGTTIINVENVVGSSFNDTLTGLSTAASSITSGAGDDVIITGSGNDTIDSGTGHDIVYGSAGADTITDIDDLVLDYSASPSSVVLYSSGSYYIGIGGFADADLIYIGDAAHLGSAKLELHLTDYVDAVRLSAYDINTVYAGAGDDNIYVISNTNFAIQSKETIYGGDGYDIIHPGNDGYDFIDFGAGGGILDYQTTTGYVNFHWAEPGGTSTVEVYSGTSTANIADHGQTLVTGEFETFQGGSLADMIFGNSADNFIFGNGGTDYIDGGAGNDHISGIGTIHGGAGDDAIYVTGALTTTGDPVNIYGDDGNDSIQVASTAPLTVWGGAGDDVIDVSAGSASDVVHGGAGADIIRMVSQTLSYSDATSAIWISGTVGKAGDALGDVIVATGSAKIVGSDFGDAFENTSFELHLGAGNNVVVNNTGTVYGNTGNDTIVGRTSGTDVIHTGGGHDLIIGNGGNDQFYFDHPGTNDQATLQYAYGDGADTIYGFTHGLDAIDIVRLAGDPDPTVTLTQASGNTTVHIAWDASHSANIVLNGVLLSSFVAGQDYHLI